MDDERLLSAIDAAEEDAYGSDQDSQLSAERALAIDLYLGKDIDPPPPGRSSVIDRSVYETIQWIMPSLCRIFASGDDVVEFQPVGPEDEAAAKQESEYLNYLITQRNRWFEVCQDWFTDALLTKNAYCWAYMDKEVSTETERYENQTLQGLALLLQDGAQIVGQEPADQSGELFNVDVLWTNEERKLCLTVLPPERCKVSHLTPSFTLRDCPYFEYWDFVTISSLRAEGYDVPDDVNDDSKGTTDEDSSRDIYSEADRDDQRNVNDPSMRRVRARHVWIRYDYNGDGIAELNYVLRVGRMVLLREDASRIPVASIVPNTLPHRHVGMSIADTVGDIQRIKTTILRNGLDNLYFANNPAIAFNKNTVNLDDVLTSRPGQRIRVDGPPQTEFLPVQTPFVFPEAMQGLEYMDQVRENRTGTNRYFTGVDQNALNKTATGIQQLSSMAAQRVEQIARIFACGIEELFSICHELVLKNGHQRETVRLRGGWVEVDPSQWRERKDMRISVGYAAGNKDAMVARLMLIAQLQEKAAAGGVPIVKADNLYQTALEITKASDFSAPQRFWTDPSTVPPPPPPQPDVTIMAAEQLKSQTTLAKTDKDNATKLQIEAMQTQVKAAELQMQPQIEREKAQIGLQADREKAAQDAQLEREKMAIGFDMETHKAALNPQMVEAKSKDDALKAMQESNAQQTQVILQALASLADAIKGMNAPRQIVRGKDGRAIGTQAVQ